MHIDNQSRNFIACLNPNGLFGENKNPKIYELEDILLKDFVEQKLTHTITLPLPCLVVAMTFFQ